MDWELVRSAARNAVSDETWNFYEGTAHVNWRSRVDSPSAWRTEDSDDWARARFVPHLFSDARKPSTEISLEGNTFSTPVMVSPCASHGLAHPGGELESAEGAARSNALYVYSHAATIGIEQFATTHATWWAQLYMTNDAAHTLRYITRASELGARAIVVTVDSRFHGDIGDAEFRRRVVPNVVRGNFDHDHDSDNANIHATAPKNTVSPEDIRWLSDHSGLPVYVKGVLTARDARIAVSAGATGIIVSNHARRGLSQARTVARGLSEVAQEIGSAVPIIADGGIRSGADVLVALALGATAVGVARPILWGLASDGSLGVTAAIDALTAELIQVMANVGLSSLGEVNRSLIDWVPQ